MANSGALKIGAGVRPPWSFSGWRGIDGKIMLAMVRGIA